ncbi:MAG: four helix bundle protein [Candidatus Moraniibacteriota bacterium]|nr:MAG: four helix bundle protein [Candidatus Moranbacteria bacterium]QQS61677.1 MAG: four helix bundle protein [Candidatus Moranbacteria bacterium]
MATYDNLPVYKASYDLLLELFLVVNNFSRDYRFTLGEHIKNETITMMMCIYRANKDRLERKKNISLARERVENIRVLLRILKDLRQIGLKKFVVLQESIELVSKQLTGWEASCT